MSYEDREILSEFFAESRTRITAGHSMFAVLVLTNIGNVTVLDENVEYTITTGGELDAFIADVDGKITDGWATKDRVTASVHANEDMTFSQQMVKNSKT